MRHKSLFEDLIEMLADAPWQAGAIVTGGSLLLLFIYPRSLLSLIFLFFAAVGAFGTIGSLIKHWRNVKIFDSTNTLIDVKKLSWREFEHFVGEYYRRKGYEVKGLGGNGPDGGIDLIATNSNGEKIIIQCKHWRAFKVPVQIVREVYGVMVDNAASGAAVITSGSFTRDAEDFVVNKPIELIDGKALAKLISEVKIAAPAPMPAAAIKSAPHQRQAVLVQTNPPPLCPHCKKEMVLREARPQYAAPGKFWGCANFPRCRYTAPFI